MIDEGEGQRVRQIEANTEVAVQTERLLRADAGGGEMVVGDVGRRAGGGG